MKKLLLLLILIAAGCYFFGFKTDKNDRTETPASSPETAKINAKKPEFSTGAKPAAAETAKPLDPFNNFPADDFYKNKDELQKFRKSAALSSTWMRKNNPVRSCRNGRSRMR